MIFDRRIELAPSVTLAVAISVAHVAAAALVWITPVGASLKAALTLAIVLGLVYFMARDATLHAPHSVVELEIRDDNRVAARIRRGDWLDCELLGSSFVSPRLTIVHLRARERGETFRVIFVPDNVDPVDFRRLRMWLRWREGETAGDGGAF